MVYWEGQQPAASAEKGAPSPIAALLQRTVLRVMAEHQSGSSGAGRASRQVLEEDTASRP